MDSTNIRELKKHSKGKTPVAVIAKATKRTPGALRQKLSCLDFLWAISVRGIARHSETQKAQWVSIAWEMFQPNRVKLVWQERGGPMLVRQSKRALHCTCI